jgi:O-antigen/teichoic acid export membrane protein
MKFSYSFYYFSSSVISKVTTYLITIYFASSLTSDQYGVWGLLYSFQTGIVMFSTTGIIESIVVLSNERKMCGSNKKIYYASYFFFILIFIFLFILVNSYFFFFDYSQKIELKQLILIFIFSGFLAAYSLLAQIFRLEENHYRSLKFSFFIPFVSTLIGLIFFYFDRSVFTYLLGLLFLPIINFIIDLNSLKRRISIIIKQGKIYFSYFFYRVIPYFVNSIFGWLSGYGMNLIIIFIFNSQEVARFTFILSTSSVMQLLATSFNQVWSPKLFSLVKEDRLKEAEISNSKYTIILTLLLVLFAFLVLLIYPYFLSYLGKNALMYIGSINSLFWILSGYVILTPWWHCANYFIVFDKGRQLMTLSIYANVIGLIIWVLLIYYFKASGIYIGFYFQMLIKSIFIYMYARRNWKLELNLLILLISQIALAFLFFLIAS